MAPNAYQEAGTEIRFRATEAGRTCPKLAGHYVRLVLPCQACKQCSRNVDCEGKSIKAMGLLVVQQVSC
jgi:hypothetical protein